MLRNMKVGTKLLAVVLPPLIVLVAVAGFGARDRLDRAGEARTSEQYIELSRASADVVAAMQRERTLSVLHIVAPGTNDQLAAQRAVTDEAIATFDRLAGELDETDVMAPLANAAVAAHGSGRTAITASVDRVTAASAATTAVDPTIVYEYYNDTITDQLAVSTAVSNEVPFTEVLADLTSHAAMLRVIEAQAKRATVYAIVIGEGQFDAEGRRWRNDREALAEAERYQAFFFDQATARQQAALRGVQQQMSYLNVDRFREAIITEVAATINIFGDGAAGGTPLALTPSVLQGLAEDSISGLPAGTTVDANYWLALTDTQLDALREPGGALLSDVTDVVGGIRSDAEQLALIYLLVTAAAIIVSGVLAVLVARRITKPLRNLTEAADRLSTEQLPALVERLKSPGSSGGEVILEPINMKRTDEIGHLADAFDAIQRVTVEVAEEQATLLKKGIGDIFVNLARRNQTLLDRQIEFIDQLESQEEDPDVLEDLFKLDHLATRMRRNAESLLVLAGIETGHRRSRPVALADVVRVAVGEVEDFARLQLLALDDAVVSGAAAMDVAHLLSELMENATSFSPPETNVEVLGHQGDDGSYVLSISDQGIGMSDEQFAETNTLLAEPPLVGLTLSRSLGFTVVGRLASRFNIQVRLTSSPTGGVTALVTLPPAILESSTISVEDAPAIEAAAVETHAVETHEVETDAADSFAPEPEAPEADDAGAPAEEPAPEWVPEAPVPSTLATAVPEGADFDAGLAALMDEGSRSEPATSEAPAMFSPGPAVEVAEAAPAEAAQVRTSAGLVKRVPRTASESETSERPIDDSPIKKSQRSPEEVRAMLSRYRSGLHRGRDSDTSDGSSPDGSN